MRKQTVLVAVAFTLLAALPSAALVDVEPGSINWGSVNTYTNIWYLDGGSYARLQAVKCYEATTSLIATHIETRDNVTLAHFHLQPLPVGSATETTVKNFWDAVFLWPTTYVTGGSGATTARNCYAYALDSMGNGTYTAWINDNEFSTALADDANYSGAVVDCNGSPCIQDNSIIDYGGHASHIAGVSEYPGPCPGDPPSVCGWTNSIWWKWRSSGIYGRTLPQPYCPLADTATPHYLWYDGAHMPTIRDNTEFVSYAYMTSGGDVWVHK